jgi:hypothetical protein
MPAALLLLAGITAAVASLFAWGKGEHAALPDWMTTFSGLLFGLTAIVIGYLALRDILRRTAVPFSFITLHIPLGIFIALVALAEFVLSIRLTDTNTYDSLIDSRGEPRGSPGYFLISNIFGTLVIGALVSAAAYVYAQALSREQSRFTKRADEQDAVGKILNGGWRDGS